MDELATYAIGLAKIQGPLAAGLAVLVYVGRNHLKADESKHADYEARVRLLEQDRVTKSDMREVHKRIDALGTQLATSQDTILRAIANRGPVR